MNGASDSVEGFVRAVALRLPGPARLRDDILAELSDGLLEAADAGERAGADRDEAIRLAVQGFGDPRALAASFTPELMLARGRRTALALLASTPIVVALWIAAARSRGSTGVSRLFDSPADHLAAGLLLLAQAICGAWTIVVTGRAGRWLHAPPVTSLLGAAAVGALTVVGDLAAIAVLTARLAQFPGTVHWLFLVAAIAASTLGALIASRAGWRCLAMTKAARPGAVED